MRLISTNAKKRNRLPFMRRAYTVSDYNVVASSNRVMNCLIHKQISARTSIIDFTVTMKGLEDQLLGRVILTEKAVSYFIILFLLTMTSRKLNVKFILMLSKKFVFPKTKLAICSSKSGMKLSQLK